MPQNDKFIGRGAMPADIEYLATRIRSADKQEVYAVSGLDIGGALWYCVRNSTLQYTMFSPEREPVGLFGFCVISTEGGLVEATPWMLCSDTLAEKHPMTFMKECKRQVPQYLDMYDILWNYVDVRNTLHVKWLQLMGFKFINTVPHGQFNLPFHLFVRTKGGG